MCWSSRSKRSWSTTTPGSRSGRGAGRWASRRAGPSSRANTPPRSSATRPGPSGTTRDGTLHFDERRSWPITPFIGTLGVAPDREVTTSIDGQGEWGGNLDIRDVAPGNRILLPIFHEGALFYLGDVHASQGDTEFTGTAAETKATVRLRLELEKGKRIPGMRIEKPGSLVAIHAEKPLDQAVETATIHLMDWLISEYGILAGRRLLPGQHLSRLSHQRLSDVPDS